MYSQQFICAYFSGEQTYKIEIADKNDNKPVFIEKNSIASIAEDSNTNSLVTEVKAVDVDAGMDSIMQSINKLYTLLNHK